MRRVLVTMVLTAAATVAVMLAIDDRPVVSLTPVASSSREPAKPPAAARGGHDELQHPSDRAYGATGDHEPDTDAPAGANGQWLPDERWVDSHWLPYEERALHRVLGTDRAEVQRALKRAPLADLVRRKGLDLDDVIARLMRPVRRELPRTVDVLTERARRTFTQRHLMQHMLFHTFHSRMIQGHIPEMLGIGWEEIHRLRRDGMSFLDMAEHRGLSRRAAVFGLRARIRADARDALKAQAMPRAQVGSLLRERYENVRPLWDQDAVLDQSRYPLPPPRVLRLDG